MKSHNGQGNTCPFYFAHLNSYSSCFLIPLEFTSLEASTGSEEDNSMEKASIEEDNSYEDHHPDETAHLETAHLILGGRNFYRRRLRGGIGSSIKEV